MESIEESAIETYCGLCHKILNPPFKISQIFVLEGSPNCALCSFCMTHVQRVVEIIQSHQLSWGENSPTGLNWMKSSGAHEYMEKSEGSIETYLKMHISEIDLEMINKDVNMGRTDPDIFEWEYHEIIKRINKPSYREDICIVLKAYCAKNPNIGYCQGMSYICMWLLLFLDKNSAFYMLSFLIEQILLPDFYSNSNHGNSLNGFYIESSTISGFLDKCIPSFSQACMPSDQFSDFFSLQLLIQLFVNAVDFESCIFLWTKLMEQGNIALIRGVVSLASVSTEDIFKGNHPLNILKVFPEKRLKNELESKFNSLSGQITQKRVEDLRMRARQHRARQWQKCEKLALRKLEKASNLDSEEILKLSKMFQEMIEVDEERGNVRYTIKLPQGMNNDSFQGKQYESGIRKDQFLEIVQNLNPKLEHSAELLFDRFDEDKSGLLDFRELTICLSVMCKGDIEEKLKICFDVYDADKSGFLQPNEMEELIKSLTKPYKDSSLDVNEIQSRMRMLCEKSGDILCFRDFVLAVKSDNILYDCFLDYFQTASSPSETLQQTRTMSKRNNRDFHSTDKNCCACLII